MNALDCLSTHDRIIVLSVFKKRAGRVRLDGVDPDDLLQEMVIFAHNQNYPAHLTECGHGGLLHHRLHHLVTSICKHYRSGKCIGRASDYDVADLHVPYDEPGYREVEQLLTPSLIDQYPELLQFTDRTGKFITPHYSCKLTWHRLRKRIIEESGLHCAELDRVNQVIKRKLTERQNYRIRRKERDPDVYKKQRQKCIGRSNDGFDDVAADASSDH